MKKDLGEINSQEKANAQNTLGKNDVYVSERIVGEFVNSGNSGASFKRIKLYAWRK